MSKRESAPEVSAGSMADIAFLLLIFFLVTTVIETDKGLDRQLPRENDEVISFKKRNILPVVLDATGGIMVDDAIVPITEVKNIVLKFLDNGGLSTTEDGYCDYCKGERNIASSENPQKAVVSLTHQRETNYGDYIAVQNELVAAYNQLRNREALRIFKMSYVAMDEEYSNPQTSKVRKGVLAKNIRAIQEKYPLNISEAQLKS